MQYYDSGHIDRELQSDGYIAAGQPVKCLQDKLHLARDKPEGIARHDSVVIIARDNK